MCILHKWGDWEQYEVTTPERRLTKNFGLCAAIEHRQKKRCAKCGKVEDEIIKTVVLG